jgi:peptide/nickel transport system substrate-binding protein
VFKKIRYLFRFILALVSKYYLAIIVGSILGIIIFISAPKIIPFLPKFRRSYTVAVVGRYTQADIPLSVQQKISVGLTTVSPNGVASPALASSWETKDAGKTYIFTIDTTKKWQDGTHIKSQDIKYNFKDTVVEYPNDTQLVIRLNDPFAPLPIIVSRPVFKTGLLGAGKYKVIQTKRNGQIIESLTLSPLDHDSDLPKIKYLFYPSEQQARTAFKLGLVQSLEEIQETADIANWPNVKLEPIMRNDRYVAVFFNTQDPLFTGVSGKNLRLALAYAIDKSRWPVRSFSPLNPNSWAYNTEVKKYELDLDHSRELLARVEKLPTEIILSTIPAYLPVAENIKSDWEKLGITVRLSVSVEINPDFSTLVIAQAVPPDPDQYNLWHSTQATNLTKFSNPRVDKLLEDGRKTLDVKERRNIYLDFQKFLVEEVPAVFLFHPTTYSLVRN